MTFKTGMVLYYLIERVCHLFGIQPRGPIVIALSRPLREISLVFQIM